MTSKQFQNQYSIHHEDKNNAGGDMSPFRGAKRVTPDLNRRQDGSDVTPVKGRHDPNMA